MCKSTSLQKYITETEETHSTDTPDKTWMTWMTLSITMMSLGIEMMTLSISNELESSGVPSSFLTLFTFRASADRHFGRRSFKVQV